MEQSFHRFSLRAQRAMIQAQSEAKQFGSSTLGTEHILLGMLREGRGTGASILRQASVSYERLHRMVASEADEDHTFVKSSLQYRDETKMVFQDAQSLATSLNHTQVGTEHLLMAILQNETSQGVRILRKMGIDTQDFYQSILEGIRRATGQEMDPEVDGTQSLLERFGEDLTQKAKEGRIDPLVGREKELQRMLQVLSRRKKNHPVLIGEPGVGKTAIVEGLAAYLAKEKVPRFSDVRIVTMDVTGMLAGAKYRGDFEERIRGFLQEAMKDEHVIVFIDELHTLMGAGASEGALDASNILKPLLTRGDLRIIGATTIDEYRKHVEKDSAFERRFMPIMVEEPSVEETVEILEGLREPYANHHQLGFTDEALSAAAHLTDRYVNDRFLPDKAVDVLDEAAARLRVAEPNQTNKSLQEEISQWEAKKEESLKRFEYGAALDAQTHLDKLRQTLQEGGKNGEKTWSRCVDAEDVARIVSELTGIPLQRMDRGEEARLLHLEESLNAEVIGQPRAVEALSKSVKRARVGLKDPKKPIGSFLFVGPTGVGKTYLAKALARHLFGSEEAMIRLDMSEYMEKHTVSRLVGSPPGYVGHDEGGQLTKQVRNRPYSVVLFDEIEKAHPDVFHILLQILDEGHLTDAKGRKVDFKNTVVILTSNVGATHEGPKGPLGFGGDAKSSQDAEEKRRDEALKHTFRPEFLNRIDEIVHFHALGKAEVREIVELLLGEIRGRLLEHGMHLELSEEAMDFLANKGYDPAYGARPLARTLRRELEDPLTDAILRKEVPSSGVISVDVEEDHLRFGGVHECQGEKALV